MTGTLDQALAYTAAGWRVFPTRPDRQDCTGTRCLCKAPLIPAAHPLGDPLRATCRGECGRQGHGFHDGTIDPDVIRAWWTRWPDANVAIPTGAPGPDVLDVDVKATGNGFGALNRLKRAGLLTGACALVRTRVLNGASEGRRSGAGIAGIQQQIASHRTQLEAYEALCDQLGEQPADVALAWLLHQPAVTATIIGPRTRDQLTASQHALDVHLADDTLRRLDEIWPGPGGEAPQAYAW